MFSKLTNSSCSRFSAFFTSIFITLHHYTAFSLSIREKGHQKVTFFDRLRTRRKSCPFLWVPPPKGRLHPAVIQMLGGSEFRLRRGFACGKTLVRRIGAAGQKTGWVISSCVSAP